MLIFLLTIISYFGIHSVNAVTKNIQNNQEINMRQQSLMDSLNQIFEMDLKEVEERDKLFASITSELEGCPYGDSLYARFWSHLYEKCDKLIETAKAKSLSHSLLTKAIKDNRVITQEHRKVLQDLLGQIYGEISEEAVKEKNELIQSLTPHFQSCIYGIQQESFDNVFSCKELIKSAREEHVSYFEVRYTVQEAVSELIKIAQQLSNKQIAKKPSDIKSKPSEQISKP